MEPIPCKGVHNEHVPVFMTEGQDEACGSFALHESCGKKKKNNLYADIDMHQRMILNRALAFILIPAL